MGLWNNISIFFPLITEIPTPQCTSDVDNLVAKRSDMAKTVVYWCTRHLEGKLFLYFIHWILWIWMQALKDELYFDCRLPVIHLPTFFVLHLSFYLVAWWHVAYGRFQSVYFSLIWAISDGRYGEISHLGTLLWNWYEADVANVNSKSR